MTFTKKHYLCGSLIFIIVAAPLVYWQCFRAVPLRISPVTTFITEPLTSDGKRVDYFLALEQLLYPPEMKTEDNGYRMILQSFGLPQSDRREYCENLRRQFYEKLGLDPDVEPTHEFKGAWSFLERDEYFAFERESWRDPWTLDTFPDLAEKLADWLAQDQVGLDRLAEAVRKSAFQFPMVREEDETSLSRAIYNFRIETFQQFRSFARTVKARANYRIGIGDIDGAIEDILTIYHLGRHVARRGLTDYLVGIAIEGTALGIPIAGNPDHPPTKEQLAYFLQELDRLPPPVTWQTIWEPERLANLGILQEYLDTPVENGENFGYDLVSLSWRFPIFDANVMFMAINRFFDAVLDLPTQDAAGIAHFETKYLRSRNPFRYLTVQSRSEQVAYEIVNPLEHPGLPAMQLMIMQRNECADRLNRLTLALLLYEAEHGNLPEGDWRLAIKPYLGEVGDDHFRCPSQDTGYALVLTDEKTPETLLLVEAPLENISAIGTIENDPSLFAEAHSLPSWRSSFRNVSFRNGTVRSENTVPRVPCC